jgi:hypothetical protein
MLEIRELRKYIKESKSKLKRYFKYNILRQIKTLKYIRERVLLRWIREYKDIRYEKV